MSLRWPDLEVLRRGGGDLIALSPLSQDAARRAMSDALRRIAPALAQLSDNGPDVAIVDALAACVEIMGFYHDRFLTESKLGSAQLLDDLGKIVALVGYRPLPAVAATAFQFFEALAAGTVGAGTRVAGKLVAPAATVTFETDGLIEVSPELNRMALSPLITRSAGALRAVVTQLVTDLPAASSSPIAAAIAALQNTRGPTLPTDDFRTLTTAMVADAQGLELAQVAAARSRGVAFERPLSRSFDLSSALISRTTVIRRLRGPRALPGDLVAFEVSEAPILHLPSVAAPELLTSTLEVFVLRPGDEALDPSEWDPALRYQEKLDFSASEVSDLHYRTFVDDALHTWIILRGKLGARTLLDDAALARVYARFVPAVGSVLGDPDAAAQGTGPSPLPDLTGVTLGLEAGYFESSLVLPQVANTRLETRATWAMVDRDLGLLSGDSVLIQDAGDGRWVRTLIDRPAGASARLLRWAQDPPAAAASSLREAHDPVDGVLDPASAKIGSLIDAANGDAFPTWSEFYAQLVPPGPLEAAGDLAIVPSSPAGVIERRRVVAAGTTYLVVRDASHVSVGDFLLLGRRLTPPFRALQPFGFWRGKPGEPPFDPRTPWLDAEVLQALEVRGNVVRLATPVSQDYFVHQGRTGAGDAAVPLAEVVVLPGVASVASGDQLRQVLTLSTQAMFKGKDDQLHDAVYASAALDRGYLAGDLRRPLLSAVPPPPAQAVVLGRAPQLTQEPTVAELWDALFVAVAGVAELQTGADWRLSVVVRTRNLRAPAARIARLEGADGTRLTADGIAGALATESKLPLISAAAGASIAGAPDGAVTAVLATPQPVWSAVGHEPGAGEFRVTAVVSFDLIPDPPVVLGEDLLRGNGTLVIVPAQASAARVFAFTWDAVARAPRVDGEAPQLSDPFEALLVSASHSAALLDPSAVVASADWRIPGSRFTTPGFAAQVSGWLVAATARQTIALDCRAVATATADAIALGDVSVAATGDPLHDATTVWAVAPGDVRIAPSAARARWTYELAPGDPSLPPSADVRIALIGARRELVEATTAADGRSAEIDLEIAASGDDGASAPQVHLGARSGDLGFPLDTLCVLEGEPLDGSHIAESAIWAWQAIDPLLADLPGPADSRFIAVLPARDRHGLATAEWPRSDAWWDPERRTLRLPTAPLHAFPGARPSDVVRLLQVLAPPVDHRVIAIQYDPAIDRSIATLAMPAGWPGKELAPAPVVVAIPHHGPVEVADAIAPVDVFTDPEGRVRWTLHFAGDVTGRWRAISVALRDWSAPAERGLAAVPLWRVIGPEAWRATAAHGPVRLIATTRDRAELVVVAAMARLDGDAIELAPLGRDDEFPPAASVERLDLAAHVRVAAAGESFELRGSTTLDLAAGAAVPPQVTAVVFVDGNRWEPITVTSTTSLPGGGHRYVLARAYRSLFPDGIAAQQPVRLCSASSELTGVPAAAAHTLRLRLLGLTAVPAPGAAANAAVFHAQGFAQRAVLDASSVPAAGASGLVVELALDAAGLAKVFDEHGAPRWTHVALAQRLGVAVPKALERQPLRVQLGPAPYPIAPGDTVVLRFPGDALLRTQVRTHGSDGLLDLVATVGLPPTEITLHGLRTPIAAADYAATLELLPSSQQAPWLLSFANDPGPSSLLATLLPYGATEIIEGDRRRFDFSRSPRLAEIFLHAGGALYLFTNERGELRGDFYTESDDQIAIQLGPTPLPNFLDAPDDTVIDQLILTSTAWAGKNLERPRPVVLCARTWTPPPGPPQLPPAQFPELAIVSAERRRVPTGTVLQSTRFNSGNFIPVAGQGATPANAAAIIANALRVAAQPIDEHGNPGAWHDVSFVTLEQLSAMADAASRAGMSPTGTMTAFEGMTYRDAVVAGVLQHDTKYVYSASFSTAGVCTLHFLFLDNELRETVRVRIQAQYEVNPGRGDGFANPIYPLETPVAPFDPAAQLALLAPGQLKPGALVFVREQPAEGVPALQWTRVTGVAGSIVDVAPPLAYVAGAGASPFEPIEVTALGKLESAAKLDAEYYASVAKAKLAPGGPLVLPLHDRLPLDVVARAPGSSSSLAASLVPGDIVLVFDERKRRAWSARRGTVDGQAVTEWHVWPDFQHQAVVKRIDADTGLLVLGTPLPDRFQIRWTLDAAAGRLTALHEDVAALRVLPHYRAPTQGLRTLTAIGSGDASHRFARFVSSLDAGTGSAVIPLAAEGVTTGNVEVLSFDPEKGKWARWLRHDKLSRAGKKDPAFVLGFRPADAGGDVPVSVTFGDGLTGQLLPTGTGNVYLRSTHIGAAPSWLARRRPLWIVERTVEEGTIEVSRRIAPPRNLKLTLESSAPVELVGGRDLASAQWQPAIELEVAMPDGTTRVFHEISEDDAAHGAHGFLLAADPRPGIVQVYLFAEVELPGTTEVHAWQNAGSRQWALDGKFYDAMTRPDLTTAPGATSLQLLATAGLRAGSLLALFADKDSEPEIVRLASIDPPTWSAVVGAPLPRAYDLERSFIRGNVARITQGAVERTTIGGSDGATASLRLPLQNASPLLYVDRPGTPPEPDVTVLVAGQPWTRVLDFTGRTASSRVWRLDVDPGGAVFVLFGDGKHGAIPPAGHDNIEATMRLGSGAAGNLAAGAINKLVSGNLAVKSTTNLKPAAGGSAGDSAAAAREKAFARKLPSDRVVSAADCVRAAIGEGGVITAALDPTAPAGTIELVVGFEDRRKPTPEDLAAVHDLVADAMPVTANPRLRVAAAEQRAVHLVIELGVTDGFLPADVFGKVAAAFGAGADGLFAAARWDVGEPLRLGTIYDAIFKIAGVATARVVWMSDTRLPEGELPSGPAPDVFDPGAIGIVRCDNDPVADPFGRFGTFRLQPPEAM